MNTWNKDNESLLMSFAERAYDKMSWAQIGRACGVSAEAARSKYRRMKGKQDE